MIFAAVLASTLHAGQISLYRPDDSLHDISATIEVKDCKNKYVTIYLDPALKVAEENPTVTNRLLKYKFYTVSPYVTLIIKYDGIETTSSTCPAKEW